jgi:hypothetical protein
MILGPFENIFWDGPPNVTFHNQALCDSFVFEDTRTFGIETVPSWPLQKVYGT